MNQYVSSRPLLLKKENTIVIRNYACRFLNKDTNIYSIVSPKQKIEKRDRVNVQKMHYKDLNFYTAPMQNRNAKDKGIENVLVSFVCPSLAKNMTDYMSKKYKFPVYVMSTNVKEFSYHATLLKTPMVTIVNWFCNIEEDANGIKNETSHYYDIFYTSRYLSDFQDYNDNNPILL